MTKKFIKLHLYADNSPAIINTDTINDVTYDVKEKYALIDFINDNESICVKESVEKIYSMIYNNEENKK